MGSEQEARWMVDNLNGNIPVGLSAPIIVKFAGDRGGKGGSQFGGQPGGPMAVVATPVAGQRLIMAAAPQQQVFASPVTGGGVASQVAQQAQTLVQLLPALGQNAQAMAALQT